MFTTRHRIPAIILCLVGAACVASGVWHVAALFAALTSRVAVIEEDSAIFAVPLLGLALVSVGVLVATGGGGRPGRGDALLFAGFLIAGAGSIAALMLGPFLLGAVTAAYGYRPCASDVGVRTVRTRYVVATCGQARGDLGGLPPGSKALVGMGEGRFMAFARPGCNTHCGSFATKTGKIITTARRSR